MPSLYNHEYHISHTYTELSDEELHKHTLELQVMKQETEVPRQLSVIDRLLGHIAFEVSQRLWEQAGDNKLSVA